MTTTAIRAEAHRDAKSVVHRYLQALRDRDAEAIGELVATDAVYRIPGSHPVAGTWTGLAEIAGKFLIPMGELFDPTADYTVDVHHVIAEGEEVAVECVTRATTRAGAPYVLPISAQFTVRDGQIRSMREYFDTEYFSSTLFGRD
ncbi:limonene-1,2-epoxide hydrolase [Streptomyces sp. WZ.A104]|uniref:nuclear transport factor 2 family protein n=1 Tax=Streptomyces sp. WZ.A104 TaxID=2023771 RepID=UPI000BBBCD5B|nr:nuclear transport factor 2 family protein [Streptomyces sp. WZ.A104]PCG86712.1 limonene-1,2-epoxide hydrolase [Streptomyces sp. WZ.A104]